MRTRIRRFPAALRRLNHRRSLAILFLAFLTAVSAATFPQSLTSLGEALREPRALPQGLTEPLDALYREMLDFKSSTLVNKGSYINLNGLMARLMGQRFINGCVKLTNGHLGGVGGEADIVEEWPQIVALCRRQTEAGKAFLFVLAPGQVSPYEPVEPVGYANYYNQAGDAMLAALRASGVPVLDLREELRDAGVSHTDAFFGTDLHWKPETGFWAFGRILDDLARRGAIPPVDPQYTDMDYYHVEVYKDWFLGSSGRRVGRFYAGVDDFSVITPTFETQLTTEIPSKGIVSRGSFAETALDWRWMQPRDYYNQDPYELYGYGNPDEMRYGNELAPVDQKVLWLGDSFGNVVVPYMSLVFGTVEDLDMRYYKRDFAQFYDEYQPDVVILLVNATGTGLQIGTKYF